MSSRGAALTGTQPLGYIAGAGCLRMASLVYRGSDFSWCVKVDELALLL
jgi:hypothetical protein